MLELVQIIVLFCSAQHLNDESISRKDVEKCRRSLLRCIMSDLVPSEDTLIRNDNILKCSRISVNRLIIEYGDE